MSKTTPTRAEMDAYTARLAATVTPTQREKAAERQARAIAHGQALPAESLCVDRIFHLLYQANVANVANDDRSHRLVLSGVGEAVLREEVRRETGPMQLGTTGAPPMFLGMPIHIDDSADLPRVEPVP